MIERHYWHRQECIDKIVRASLPDECDIDVDYQTIVDIGAGYDRWPSSTDAVDYKAWPDSRHGCFTHHIIDIDFDRLPWCDQSVDFLYTRHTLEDIGNPLFAIREIQRVAKRGYIETPSPVAEFCRGVDYNKKPWRGYHHHRHFIWNEGSTLYLLPKYPIVETMHLDGEGEQRLEQMLNENPVAWNTYFWFEGPFEVKLLRHDVDFNIMDGYAELITRAINTSFLSAVELAKVHGLEPSDFVANA